MTLRNHQVAARLVAEGLRKLAGPCDFRLTLRLAQIEKRKIQIRDERLGYQEIADRHRAEVIRSEAEPLIS